LFFVDNIRVLLTILVLLHHLMITYAGTGGWIYKEGRQDLITDGLGSWFCGVNQAYFMGLFLLISAYFVPGSYDRKGAGRFLKDRLIRLGIPLALYSWVINPLFIYAYSYRELQMPFWRFFPGVYFSGGELIGQGPLWFVEVLLIFSLVYVAWRLVFPSRPETPAAETPFPGNGAIALFALSLAVVTFLVRLVFLMDAYTFKPLNLQLPFFAQYIALFVIGLIAYRRNWLVNLPDKTGRLWLGIAGSLILLWAPLVIFAHVHRLDLRFPPLSQFERQDSRIPCPKCVHGLPHPRSGDNFCGTGSAGYNHLSIVQMGIGRVGGNPIVFWDQQSDPQVAVYGASLVTIKSLISE
jgi:hypothetical protein